MILNGIIFLSVVFTTLCQADQKNSCLGYECHADETVTCIYLKIPDFEGLS